MRKNGNSLICQLISILFLSVLTTSCEKDDTIKVSDIDGNEYNTLTTGGKIWMAEGLKTTKYNDGTPVAIVTDNTAWSNLTTGASCDYNNTPSNSQTYGKLYNWYAVTNAKKLCPAGWHVPTESDWTALITSLGGSTVSGGKIKETGTTHWAAPNSSATNESGFTALGSGYRNYLGVFKDLTYMAGFWSATEVDASYAYHRSAFFDFADVESYGLNKKTGLSVRCVKD